MVCFTISELVRRAIYSGWHTSVLRSKNIQKITDANIENIIDRGLLASYDFKSHDSYNSDNESEDASEYADQVQIVNDSSRGNALEFDGSSSSFEFRHKDSCCLSGSGKRRNMLLSEEFWLGSDM